LGDTKDIWGQSFSSGTSGGGSMQNQLVRLTGVSRKCYVSVSVTAAAARCHGVDVITGFVVLVTTSEVVDGC